MKTLIIQGGGFRTAFTAGVLDTFIAQQHDPFDQYIGVSGGANAMSYFLGRQYKDCIRSIHVLLEDPKFMNYKQFLGTSVLMNVDFFEEIASEIVKLDLPTIFEQHSNKKISIVATDRITGEPAYFFPTPDNWVHCLIASCAIPFVTKAKHSLEGRECMDGAWSDPLPVQWAIDQGATDIVVLRTSHSNTKEKKSLPDYFGEKYYKNHPGLKQIFSKSHLRFNSSLDLILNPPEGINIEQIQPVQKLKTGGYTNSKTSLEMDYRQGLEVGLDYLNSLKNK
jgi:predicted patatin/cPLA2 family phospholipase